MAVDGVLADGFTPKKLKDSPAGRIIFLIGLCARLFLFIALLGITMLGIGHLSNVLGPEGLKLIAAEGDEKKDAPKDEKKKDEKAPEATDLPPAPVAPLMPLPPVWGPGTQLRDIFSGNVGTVAEQPLGDFGDILFVTFDGETSPIRLDQLEPLGDAAGPFGTSETPIPGLEEGTPAAGSPIPGAPAADLSNKPQALPEVPPKTPGEKPKAALTPKTNLKAADPQLEKVAKVVEGKNFVDMREPLEALFGKKSVSFSFEPVAHFVITSGGKKILLVNEQYAEDSEKELVVGTTAIGFMASLKFSGAPKSKKKVAPVEKPLWDHEPDEEEIKEALENEGIGFYSERYGKSHPSVDVKVHGFVSPDYPAIKKLFDEYAVPEELREDMIEQTFRMNQESWWDDASSWGTWLTDGTGPFEKMLKDKQAKVYSEGRSGGHLTVDTSLYPFIKDMSPSDGDVQAYGLDMEYVNGLKTYFERLKSSVSIEDISENVAGQLETNLEDGQFSGPAGEWWDEVAETKEKTPGTQENMRMLEREGQGKLPLESRKLKDGRTILLAKRATLKPIQVKADLVTSDSDPRKLAYSSFLVRMRAAKEKTHAAALTVIGYIPEKWDLLVARLAKDGVQLVSPKGQYDVMSLLKRGHNAEEVRFLLAGKGVPVYSIDAVLKLAAEKPTTPPPQEDPGAGKVWAWDAEKKGWYPADAVTASKVKGARMDFSNFGPGETWWGVASPDDEQGNMTTEAEFPTAQEAIDYYKQHASSGYTIDKWELGKDRLPHAIKTYGGPSEIPQEELTASIKAGGIERGVGHPEATAIDWTETPKAFTFTVNPAMQEELKAAVAAGESGRALYDLLDQVIANSDIDWLRPEEIGALTDAPIFGHVERDDQGNIKEVGDVWWYPNYMVSDPIEELAEKGTLVFEGEKNNGLEDVDIQERSSQMQPSSLKLVKFKAELTFKGADRADIQSDPMLVAYLTAALWATNDESTPQGGEPLDANYDLEDLSDDYVAKVKADIAKFKEGADKVEGYSEFWDAEQAGHDLFLTRNGHGAGFWDRDLDFGPEDKARVEKAGEELSELAKALGEDNLVVGDDGKIHNY